MKVANSLAKRVRARANHSCEYCKLPERFDDYPFEIEHVVAAQHGGKPIYRNLALACMTGNRHKGPNLAGIDPRTHKRVWLFDPRKQKWARHFRWKGPVLVGRTSVGRATVAVLGINVEHRVRARAELIAEGVFPSGSDAEG
ncbi:MAG: HNH endonuclease signature motif containing protein [Gemmataceae bacterium]